MKTKTIWCENCGGDGSYDVIDYLYQDGDMDCHVEQCEVCGGEGKVEIEVPHWTDVLRLNKKFFNALRESYGAAERFTVPQAYEVNERVAKHREETLNSDAWNLEHGQPIDRYWIHMCVRNQLCKLVEMEIIERIDRGIYRFTSKGQTVTDLKNF